MTTLRENENITRLEQLPVLNLVFKSRLLKKYKMSSVPGNESVASIFCVARMVVDLMIVIIGWFKMRVETRHIVHCPSCYINEFSTLFFIITFG